MDTKAFRKLSYGLYLVTSTDGSGYHNGCIVNTFQQVASEPPMASVALHKDNLTTEMVRTSGYFGATALTESADMGFFGRFGFRSGRDGDKFAGIDFAVDDQDIAYVAQHANARFRVKVMHMLDLGSHFLFVGMVDDAEVLGDSPSITYAYYHRELRGRSPKNAVNYEGGGDATSDAGSVAGGVSDAKVGALVDEEEEMQVVEPGQDSVAPRYGWRCLICGCIVEQAELPDDFTCPVCGVGKEMFERVEL